MIDIRNIDFYYGKFRLFQNLSLMLIPGKIYGLLGKNGAGKTTLLKIISGLVYPASGECILNEQNTRYRFPDTLVDIFFIPETYQLPEMGIEKFITEISAFYPKFEKELFFRQLAEFEVDRKANLLRLSYGQKKKFLLAFGIATHCKILIFDEPTNGLDIPSQRIIRNALSRLAKDNRVILISTHHVREMEEVFDSIVVLDRGVILYQNDIERIRDTMSIEVVPSLEGQEGIIYSEPIPGGFSVLKKRKAGENGKLDMEFLFNAITQKPDLFHETASTGVPL